MIIRPELVIVALACAGPSPAQPAFIVRDLWPGERDSVPRHDRSPQPRLLAGLGDTLFFLAADGGGGIDLWSSDGSLGGTLKVRNFGDSCLGTYRSHSLCFPLDLVASGGKVFFANADANGAEPWVTDGTAGGTALLKDLEPGGDSLFVGGETENYWGSLTDVNGTIFLASVSGGVWKSNGTRAGTVKLNDLPPSGCEPELVSGFASRGGEFLFVRTCGLGELWRSDGTPDGTRVVKSFSRGVGGPIVVLDDLAFFVADDGQGRELWKYDGTTAALVKDILPGTGSPGIQSDSLRAVRGLLYFRDGERNLWESDGSAAGTVMVQAIEALGGIDFIPDEVVELGFFSYFTGEGALWRCDHRGGHKLTRRLQDIEAANLTAAGGSLFFTAEDDDHGMELWALPVEGTCDVDVIVDNGTTGTSFTGQWRASDATLDFGTDSVWSRVNSKLIPAYRFQAHLPPGVYEVLEWHSSFASRTRSARHVITHGGGTSTIFVDQSIDGGKWNTLGTFSFVGPAAVEIRAEDPGRSTNADAVRYRCDAQHRPNAIIDRIAPRPATSGQEVCFQGRGEGRLPIIAFEWLSSLQPGVLLGDDDSFCHPDLETGTHSILFRVQDSSGTWSRPAYDTLVVPPGGCNSEVVIDNGGPGASAVDGAWQSSASPGFLGTGSVWAKATSTVNPVYRFETTLPAGTYEVFEWHTNWSTRSKSVPHILDDDGPDQPVTEIFVDQSVRGARWNSLGTYPLSGKTRVSIVAKDRVNSTNADAIRIVCRTLANP